MSFDKYDVEEVLRILEIEKECISRDCDRNCGECDLVQDEEYLLNTYDKAICIVKEYLNNLTR